MHFRQGRPSSDPSHEDFVPHLYLNREPPEEILNYLESLDDSRNARTSVAGSSSTSSDVAVGQASGKNKPTNSRDAFESGRPTKNVRAPKPSILQRKRKQRFDDNQRTQNPSVQEEVVERKLLFPHFYFFYGEGTLRCGNCCSNIRIRLSINRSITKGASIGCQVFPNIFQDNFYIFI